MFLDVTCSCPGLIISVLYRKRTVISTVTWDKMWVRDQNTNGFFLWLPWWRKKKKKPKSDPSYWLRAQLSSPNFSSVSHKIHTLCRDCFIWPLVNMEGAVFLCQRCDRSILDPQWHFLRCSIPSNFQVNLAGITKDLNALVTELFRKSCCFSWWPGRRALFKTSPWNIWWNGMHSFGSCRYVSLFGLVTWQWYGHIFDRTWPILHFPAEGTPFCEQHILSATGISNGLLGFSSPTHKFLGFNH